MLDIFWLFFIISTLQPIIKQRYLDASRQRLIAKIERKRGSRVILLVHREETMSLLGFPIVRYIDINDSEQVLRAIHMTDPDVPIDIILHTPGGLVLAALQIARAIHLHKAKVTAFVPHYAMSGGTLIALAADEIAMCESAVLGPVDPQLGQNPAASLLRVIREKPIAEVDDETLIMADQAEKAIFQLREAVKALLVPKLGQEPGGGAGPRPDRGDLDARLSDHLRCGDPVEVAGPLRRARRGHRAHGAVPPARPAAGERRVPFETSPPAGALVVETPEGNRPGPRERDPEIRSQREHRLIGVRRSPMGWSWRIGRIAGIDVYVHFTFLLLLVWVGIEHYLAHGDIGEAIGGLVFILALFGIVVLHELGHALTARRFGIRTRDIILLPIGGVARLERMPDDPRQELLVALAGPAVNVVLAAVIYVVLTYGQGLSPAGEAMRVGGGIPRPALLGERLPGAVQLDPGLPDGRRPGAPRLAVHEDGSRAGHRGGRRIGQGLALLFAFIGLFSNPWLVFIGLFVWLAATEEASMVQMRSALDGIHVGQVMVTDFRTLRPDDPLARALEYARAGFQEDFPVVEDGRLVGVLTRRRPDRRAGEPRRGVPRRGRHASGFRRRRAAGDAEHRLLPAAGMRLPHASGGAARPPRGTRHGG